MIARLTGIPIPPSANKQLRFSRAMSRFVKTKHATRFDRSTSQYEIENATQIRCIQRTLKDYLSQGKVLKLNLHFFFKKESLLTKKNEIKIRDLNNLLKSAIDAVSNMVDVDDSVFFSHEFSKRILTKNVEEYFEATIYSEDPKNYDIINLKPTIRGAKRNKPNGR